MSTLIARVHCPHRVGLAFIDDDGLSLLPCDCNEPTEVLETFLAQRVTPVMQRVLALADDIEPTDRVVAGLIRSAVEGSSW